MWNRFLVSENPRGLILGQIRWKGAEIEGIFGPDPGVHLLAHDFLHKAKWTLPPIGSPSPPTSPTQFLTQFGLPGAPRGPPEVGGIGGIRSHLVPSIFVGKVPSYDDFAPPGRAGSYG